MSDIPLGNVTAAKPESVAAPVAATGASVSAAAPAITPTGQPSAEALLVMARQVGEALKSQNAGLDYKIDMVGGSPRLRVIDRHSGQILRQFPSDQVLSAYHGLKQGKPVLVSNMG